MFKYQQIFQQQAQTDAEINTEKYLNEYSTVKAVTLRHFLQSVDWIPLKRERPQSYPQSLTWRDTEQTPSIPTTTTKQSATRIRLSAPRECLPTQYACCAGTS
jgi:hypothetical protein